MNSDIPGYSGATSVEQLLPLTVNAHVASEHQHAGVQILQARFNLRGQMLTFERHIDYWWGIRLFHPSHSRAVQGESSAHIGLKLC